VLKKANPKDIDLLVLPELAFTGTFHFISFEASGLLGRLTAIIGEKFRSGRLLTLQPRVLLPVPDLDVETVNT